MEFEQFANEIQVLVFEHLPIKDILSVRLVSKQFFYNSGQFFRPRVVIAKRFDSLLRLQRFLTEEKSLHQCVEELVWDVSEFQEDVALDFEDYLQGCLSTNRSFKDISLVHEDAAYRDFTRKLGGIQGPSTPWHLEDFGRMNDDDVDGYPPKLCFAGGMHVGFTDYNRRFMYQEWFKTDDVQFRMLAVVLCKLKLKSIVLAGFEELAGPDEDYAELCDRLFGNTLQPEELSRANIERDRTGILEVLGSHPTQSITVSEQF